MNGSPACAPLAGWKSVRAGDVLHLINGRAFKPSEWQNSGLPIIRIQNLNDPTAPFNYFVGDLPERFRVLAGDLLFAWSGTPGTSFGAHIWRGGPAWLNQHIFKVLFDEAEFDKRFLKFAINQNLAEYIRLAHGGAGLAHITKGRFEDSLLPKPPLDEQQRLVDEIEEQLTRLDAGVDALRQVQTGLKRYRAAVLKAACEGRLVPTEADLARREGRPYEPASVLLERIRAEKTKLAATKAAAPSRRSRQRRDAAASLPPDLPPLAEGWTWATVGDLCASGRPLAYGILQPGPHLEAGTPIVRVGDIDGGRVAADKLKRVSPNVEARYPRTRLRGGEIVLTVVGTIGRAGVVPEALRGANTARAVAVLPLADVVMPEWVSAYLNSPQVVSRLASKAHEVARKTLNLEDVRSANVAIPPVAEQHRIVAEVERRLSLAGALDRSVTANLHRATRLRQSVLTAAFRGEIARDEPEFSCGELRQESLSERLHP
jgi:type I restriction enzyme S subunit